MISNFELEALNYMEHYGLIRVKGEPIEYRHSWDNDNVFRAGRSSRSAVPSGIFYYWKEIGPGPERTATGRDGRNPPGVC